MNKQNQLNILSQLYNEYKLQITEKDEPSSRDQIASQFKLKFITKFEELEPTDMIKLCYEYFWNIISDSNEKKIFFDYNLLMFEIISSRLVRKPRVLDVWFSPSHENKRKFMKLLNQAQKEIVICLVPLKNFEINSTLANLAQKSNFIIKIIVENNLNENINGNIQMKCLRKKDQTFERYIIIDKRIMINGFLEWDQKEQEHKKSITLIENESLARAFCQNFDILWEKSEGIIYKNNVVNSNNQNESFEKNKKMMIKDKKNLSFEKKTYRKIGIKKFRRLMKKIKRKRKHKISNLKRNQVKRKIEKTKNKPGMIYNILGYVKKIFK